MTRLRYALNAFRAAWKTFPAFQRAQRELWGIIELRCDCKECERQRGFR